MKAYNYRLLIVVFFLSKITFAQDKQVSGMVTDNNGLPLPGVNVLIKNSNNGTQTDFDGFYRIETSIGEVISFRYLGFSTKEVVVGDNKTINVELLPSESELEEIVIVGYGVKSKTVTTTAITTIGVADIEDFVPSTSVDNLLQGKAAGVQVTALNGRPGQNAYVQIRGIGSISASSTPLYVVDGIPLNEESINNINPNDIEFISILKDAASASLYGSRAANGVVLITTKKGKTGDSKITFRSSVGSASRTKDPFDIMNASQKLALEKQYADIGINAAKSTPGAKSSPEELAVLKSLDTNWEEELLRSSYIQSNSLSIIGGADKLTYFLSLGYDKNTGIIDRIKGFERISTRLNTTYQAKDWLSIGVNVAVSRNTVDLSRDRYNAQNPFNAMYIYNPYEPLYARDKLGNIKYDAKGEPIYNRTSTGFPVARALLTEPENNRNLLNIGNISADIKLSNSLINNFKFGITNRRFNKTTASKVGGVLQEIVGDVNFPGLQIDEQFINFEYNISNIVRYNKSFNDVHNLGVSFLLEFYQQTRTGIKVTSRGFPTSNIPYQEVAAQQTDGTTKKNQNAIFSEGLFVDYDYDEKYIISGTIRRDGSTRFSGDNKYGNFYSGSLAWNLAKEDFLINTAINNLKLRGSYGTSGNDNIVGNDDIGNFNYLDLIKFNQTYNGGSTAIPKGIGNPDIKWESQSQLDIGVEFGLWNNRVNGAIDYYIKKSEDLLLPRPISATLGDQNNSIISNIGEIENKGIELEINTEIIKSEDFRLSVGGTVSFIDNKVNKLVDGKDIIRGNTILREGEKINSFFLVRYIGVDPKNGKPLFLDKEGNETEKYSSGNAVMLKDKSPAANIEGGLYTFLEYKGLGLRSDFVFKSGNYINNRQLSQLLNPNNIRQNQSVDAFNYWKQEGDTNVLPSPLYGNTSNQTSDRFLQKGDYIRLRSVTLSYDIPSKVLQVLPITSFRVYAQGQNLLTITAYDGDPEIGLGSDETAKQGDEGFVPGEFSLFSYPQTKSYTVGIEIGF